jgi:phosphatidylglycerophosphate synthase
MFDGPIRRRIDPALDRVGRRLAASGVTADALTLMGCALGLGAAGLIVAGWFVGALALFLVSRLADGLDGAVARARTATDRGGYLDIVADFAVYAAIPLAFALHDPGENALAAAMLLAAIVFNGSAFLAFAVLAAKRGLTTSAQGAKSLYFLAGLAEGAETIAVYGVMCVWPAAFAPMAFAFAALCLVSALARVGVAARRLT